MLTTIIVAAVVAAGTPPPAPACTAPDGTRVHLDLALTPAEQQRGLMFRDVLPADRGMLFVFDHDGVLPFWMKNTIIPLDFVWLSADGRVVDVRAGVQPCEMDPCPSYSNARPARAVLEVNAGFAAKHGIRPDAALRFEGVPGYPAAGAKR